ncbi:hypothetical protein B0H16DRAFT_1452368 [Mycena metata]|uniref:Uncharacterized protein n=1 Tax=Mycena metata TaxID=1033252 RepID=A0AAD7NQA8_9AGAR|nr:hypothetical protein B0H16DRAFT_1452368 [Mycena metata]
MRTSPLPSAAAGPAYTRLGSPFQLSSRYPRFEPYKREYEARLRFESKSSISSDSPLTNMKKSTELLARMNHGQGNVKQGPPMQRSGASARLGRVNTASMAVMAAALDRIRLSSFLASLLAAPPTRQVSRHRNIQFINQLDRRQPPKLPLILLAQLLAVPPSTQAPATEAPIHRDTPRAAKDYNTHPPMPNSFPRRCPHGVAREHVRNFVSKDRAASQVPPRRCPHGIVRTHVGSFNLLRRHLLIHLKMPLPRCPHGFIRERHARRCPHGVLRYA